MHVVHQCDGLSKVGHEVDLFLGDTRKQVFSEDVLRDFEAEFKTVNMLPVRTGRKGQAFTIASWALFNMAGAHYDLVLSRNLYFAWIYSQIFRKQVLYEVHDIEKGVFASMQKALIQSKNVTTVLISRRLKKVLEDVHDVSVRDSLVLHDAAPEGSKQIEGPKKRIVLSALLEELCLVEAPSSDGREKLSLALDRNPENVTGYFGKLCKGGCIESISSLARKNKDDVFIVFGENCEEVLSGQTEAGLSNLFFMGYVPNGYARRLQATCDILLLPYQSGALVSHVCHDANPYTSPIKLFEYMASGTPFISTDHPVFREVLADRKHALLVPSEDPEEWNRVYQELAGDQVLRAELAREAYKRYQKYFNWTSRARQIIEKSFTADNEKRAA